MKNVLLLVTAILFSSFAFGQSAKAVKNYEKGTKSIESGNYQEAIKFLTLTINDYPTGNAYFNRSVAYLYLRDTCSYCSDLKKASEYEDFEAQKLYFETCTYCTTITNLPDSIKSKNLKIKSIQVFYSKCNSDSTIKYIYEDNLKATNATEIKETDTSAVFLMVETAPEFPGGDKGRMLFLHKNMKYPPEAREAGKQGTVYVTFMIETDGSVSEISILRSPDNSLSKEAIRVVRLMPKWKPGTQKGKPVRVQYNMPMKFTLQK